MVLGYAYPAYECYKTVEKNKPEIEQLRFWCQYWYVLHRLLFLSLLFLQMILIAIVFILFLQDFGGIFDSL